MNCCQYCNQHNEITVLRQELSSKNEELERLKLDLTSLNQKYVSEIERVMHIQHEKDLVEQELEDLSRKLFEEANMMVSIEKKARFKLENELVQTKEFLSQEKQQLQELKSKILSDNTQDIVKSSTSTFNNNRAQMDLEELHGLKRVSANHIMNYQDKFDVASPQRNTMPPPATKKMVINKTIDELQLNSFHEYIIAALNKLLTLKKLNQTNFMKRCLTEDIEPCLNFGLQSKLSTKKMIDHLLKQTCFIEHHFNDTTQTIPVAKKSNNMMWNRLTTTSVIISNHCSACNRPSFNKNNENGVLLNYRFKLNENDIWLPIDQYCRDRLVAVCEFFVFIRNIQLGLYTDRSIQDLYTENIRLRLQIFYSRMGALPVVLDDLGLDPNEIGKATEPTMMIKEEDEQSHDSFMSIIVPHPEGVVQV